MTYLRLSTRHQPVRRDVTVRQMAFASLVIWAPPPGVSEGFRHAVVGCFCRCVRISQHGAAGRMGMTVDIYL